VAGFVAKSAMYIQKVDVKEKKIYANLVKIFGETGPGNEPGISAMCPR
jgi:hypothetical protein